MTNTHRGGFLYESVPIMELWMSNIILLQNIQIGDIEFMNEMRFNGGWYYKKEWLKWNRRISEGKYGYLSTCQHNPARQYLCHTVGVKQEV